MTFVTDERGDFLIEGLLPRTYDLKAVDLKTLRVTYLRGVPAGSQGVLVKLPALGDGGPVAGVVVDSDGVPMAGARVQAGLAVRSWVWPNPELGLTEEFVMGPDGIADEQGRFLLQNVPLAVDRLDVVGANLLSVTRRIADGADRGTLVLVVPSRRQVQLEVAGAFGDASHFRLLDQEGKGLFLYTFEGLGYSSSK